MVKKIFKGIIKLYYIILIKLKYKWTLRKKRKQEQKIKSLLREKLADIEISNSVKEKIIHSYLALRNKILSERFINYSLKMHKINFELEAQEKRQKA